MIPRFGGLPLPRPAARTGFLSIKQALATPRLTGIQRSGLDVQLSFTSLPLAFYRVQWASDLTAGVWNTLTNYGPGAGGILRITDGGALLGQPQRFYRVQTPP